MKQNCFSPAVFEISPPLSRFIVCDRWLEMFQQEKYGVAWDAGGIQNVICIIEGKRRPLCAHRVCHPLRELNINSSGLIWSVSIARIFSRLWMHGSGPVMFWGKRVET